MIYDIYIYDIYIYDIYIYDIYIYMIYIYILLMITILPLYHTHRISIETWMLHLPGPRGPRLATWSSPPSSAPASAAPSGAGTAGTSGAASGFNARSLENGWFVTENPQWKWMISGYPSIDWNLHIGKSESFAWYYVYHMKFNAFHGIWY